MYYGSDTFSFLIFWMMVLEVTMTQSKNDNLQKTEYWSTMNMENKQRVRKRENREEFQHQNKRHSHADFIFSKKMITKKLLWVRLCSFQPTDICARVHVCLHVRARARKEDSDEIARFFATQCCNSCTHCVKTRQLDLCGHKYQGHYKDRQDLFVPRQ